MRTPIDFQCPKCGAVPGARCRTTTGTNRTTDLHVDRWESAYPMPSTNWRGSND